MGFEETNDSYTNFAYFMTNLVCWIAVEEFLIAFCHAIEL